MSTAIKVMIFGVGPSGLAAAQAVLRAGGNVTMVANTKEPSKLYGCQYLHAPIPGYEDVPTASVSYSLAGTPEEYRRKVYGHLWDGKVSPEDFIGEHVAWDIRETYSRLWGKIIQNKRRWGSVKFVNANISPSWIVNPFLDPRQFDAIISTIPAKHICHKPGQHEFNSHIVFASGSTSPGMTRNNSIICDGTDKQMWYRHATVFGYSTTEWTDPPNADTATVEKPLDTNCNCFPDIVRMGRYGAWKKGVLVHDVYNQTIALMNKLEER